MQSIFIRPKLPTRVCARRSAMQSIFALGFWTLEQFDGDRNEVLYRDDNRNRTESYYDKDNRRTRTVDALSGVATALYDADGNRTVAIDALGRTTTYAYDTLNRLTQTTHALGGLNTSLYYPAGHLTTAI